MQRIEPMKCWQNACPEMTNVMDSPSPVAEETQQNNTLCAERRPRVDGLELPICTS